MQKYIAPAFMSLVLFAAAQAQVFHYDFESDYQGWTADWADYNIEHSEDYDLKHEHAQLPDILPAQNGLSLYGKNNSDDLFPFVKRKIAGLSANTEYSVDFTLDIGANSPPDGIGGPSYWLKAGVTLVEPKKVDDGKGYYRMNIDKANQAQPGPDMDMLGYIRHTEKGSWKYHLVTFKNAKPFKFKTDAKGEGWIIVGAESSFETMGTFWIGAIKAEFKTPTALRTPKGQASGKSRVKRPQGAAVRPVFSLGRGERAFTPAGRSAQNTR